MTPPRSPSSTPHARRGLALLGALLMLAGAPGGAATAASPEAPAPVGVVLAPDVSTTSLVTSDQGGYLSLFAPDGSFYTLTVPPGAVLSDVDMTMTLATSITGSPLGDQLVGAVDLGPSGLELQAPAMLTITPATPLAVGEEGPFTAAADGAGFHMTPLTADPSTFTMPILHFTVFGLMRTDPQHRAGAASQTAADSKAQLAQELTQLLQDAREHDGEMDSNKIIDLLDRYRDAVVVPLMTAAETDPGVFWQALREWLGWERQRQLWGIEEPMDQELLASFKVAFATYVEHTKERCYQHDFGVVIDYLRLARMDALLGGVLGLATDGTTGAFLDKCLTFTLEMDAETTADLNTCAFINSGSSHLTQDLRLTASVVLKGMSEGPWTAPMRWVTGKERADCHLQFVAKIDGEYHATGFGDPGELTVVSWKPDLNVTAAGDETVAVLKLRHIVVVPGDAKLTIGGDTDLLIAIEQQGSQVSGFGGSDRSSATESVNWPQLFWDATGADAVTTPVGSGYELADWVPTGDGDQLARRDHSGSAQTRFGTTTGRSTFFLRHTPIR